MYLEWHHNICWLLWERTRRGMLKKLNVYWRTCQEWATALCGGSGAFLEHNAEEWLRVGHGCKREGERVRPGAKEREGARKGEREHTRGEGSLTERRGGVGWEGEWGKGGGKRRGLVVAHWDIWQQVMWVRMEWAWLLWVASVGMGWWWGQVVDVVELWAQGCKMKGGCTWGVWAVCALVTMVSSVAWRSGQGQVVIRVHKTDRESSQKMWDNGRSAKQVFKIESWPVTKNDVPSLIYEQ